MSNAPEVQGLPSGPQLERLDIAPAFLSRKRPATGTRIRETAQSAEERSRNKSNPTEEERRCLHSPLEKLIDSSELLLEKQGKVQPCHKPMPVKAHLGPSRKQQVQSVLGQPTGEGGSLSLSESLPNSSETNSGVVPGKDERESQGLSSKASKIATGHQMASSTKHQERDPTSLPHRPPAHPPPPLSQFLAYPGFHAGSVQSHLALQENSNTLHSSIAPLAHRNLSHHFSHPSSQVLPHNTALGYPPAHPTPHIISPFAINPMHHPYSFSHAVTHPVTHHYGHMTAQRAPDATANGSVLASGSLLEPSRDKSRSHARQQLGQFGRKSSENLVPKDSQPPKNINGCRSRISYGSEDDLQVMESNPRTSSKAKTGSSKRERLAYVNGDFISAEKAHVPISDFGFAYGCAIVEEVLVAQGVILRLDAHVETFMSSAKAIDLPVPLSGSELRAVCKQIVGNNEDGERAALYIHLSFGAYGSRSRRLPPSNSLTPSLIIDTQPLAPIPSKHLMEGISLYPAPDYRPSVSVPDEPSVSYMSSSQLPEILALHTALKNDYDEAVLFDPTTDDVTGTTQGNIFCVKFGVIYTPPATGRVPDGVMRRYILKVCVREKIDTREVNITRPFLSSATEVFCTSNLDQVLPVRMVANRVIADGKPGQVTRKVMNAAGARKTSHSKRRHRSTKRTQRSDVSETDDPSESEDMTATQRPRQSSSSSRGQSSSPSESGENDSQDS